MSDDLFGPISFGHGARWNPLTRATDDPDILPIHAVLDVMLVIRGTRPNVALGLADEFVWAGEWGLAIESIEGELAGLGLPLTELEREVLRRARALIFGGVPDSSG
ncbi:hypothetical protein [Methylobrevis pamukkalensis]|uniref:Uncharacterized protein n=1 Tax=Methylobrevis pamukkalensis TaxID=1439726 RepID=A0A1E3H6T0_9HYPH|nr:hypothetical protein [Methylobrevis pamukkalensis]ODN72038.1 hypothetical protein A6302_00663 [Methylobrevis pamukkalensis]